MCAQTGKATIKQNSVVELSNEERWTVNRNISW